MKYRQACGRRRRIRQLLGGSPAHVTYNCARMYYSGAHEHPEGAGNDAAPLAAELSENGKQQPVIPESTSEPPSAGADSCPVGATIDLEITRPRVRLRQPPLRVEAGRFGLTLSRLAGSGARLLVKPRRGRSLEVRAAHELRRTFALMGPTYVKLGQLIASSPESSPKHFPTSSGHCSTGCHRPPRS